MKKKRLLIVLLLILIMIPITIAKYSKEAKADSLGPMSAYGYKISIVRYTGSGEPERIGEPILVYQSGLFDTVVKTIKGSYPSGTGEAAYNSFLSNNWGVNQFVYDSTDDGDYHTNVANYSFEDDSPDWMQSQHDVFLSDDYDTTIFSNPNNKRNDNMFNENERIYCSNCSDIPQPEGNSSDVGENKGYVYYEEKYGDLEGSCVTGKKSTEFSTGVGGYDELLFRYMTNEKRITYPRSRVMLDEEYHAMYQDSGSIQDIVMKYAGDTNKVSTYFGINLLPNELKNYYIQVEIMQRALEYNVSNLTATGSYDVISYKHTVHETPKWYSNGNGWVEEGRQGCYVNGELKYLPFGSRESITDLCTYCNCPEGSTCNDDCQQCHEETNYNYNCKIKLGNFGGCSTSEKDVGSCLFSYIRKCESTYTTTECSEENYYVTEDLFELYEAGVSRGTGSCDQGIEYRIILYGTTYDGPSYIVPSWSYNGVDANPTYFLSLAGNSCTDDNSEHCRLNDNGECSGKYLYYTGPNLEEALVGPREGGRGGYLHTIENATCPTLNAINEDDRNALGCTCSGGISGTGIQIFYFIDILPPGMCQEECSKVGNRYSDEFLVCAERYAEGKVDYNARGNARKRKLEWLIDEDKCNYSYGTSPTIKGSKTAKDRESENSCNNTANPYGGGALNALESKCSAIGNNPLRNYVGTKIEACEGDQITDFDGEENDTPYDQRTYINKICKEDVSFDYKDLSKEMIPIAGAGFTYPIVETGNRTCMYYINLEQWKFDYASAPGRDPIRRKRLLYILDMYNTENKIEKNRTNYDERFEEEYEGDVETFGKTNYEREGYDFSKTNVNVEIEEKLVNDKIVKPTTQSMIITGAENLAGGINPVNKPITAYQMLGAAKLRTNVTMSTIKNNNDKVTIIENGTVNTKLVERYETDAKGNITYGLERVCISTDGNATVYKSPENGICGTNARGSIIAENKHYTDFNIKINNKNPVKSTVTVGMKSATDAPYYTNKETCEYGIKSTGDYIDEGRGCTIELLDETGATITSPNIFKEKVTAVIRYRIASTSITETITDNGAATVGGNTLEIHRAGNKAEDYHRIIGTITYKNSQGDYETTTCEREVTLQKNGGCGSLSCNLVKKNEKNYEIETTGGPSYFSYYINTAARYDKNYSHRKEIAPSITEPGKSYIALDEPLQAKEKLVAVVSNGSCEALCMINKEGCKEECCGDECNKQNCTKIYKAADTEGIYNYCSDEENIKQDVNNYKDKGECFERCSTLRRCEYYGCSKEKAENFCSAKWEAYEYGSESQCMNECYVDCEVPQEGNGSKYLFRTVNVLDPFPNSPESVFPYEKGKRVVGANWNQLSEYIVNDEEDGTTITGPGANQMVEYVIDLTPADIRQIRQDTETSNMNNGKRKRAVYAKLDRVKTSSNIIQEYKSNFIHNSQFVKLFKSGHGNTPSSFTP